MAFICHQPQASLSKDLKVDRQDYEQGLRFCLIPNPAKMRSDGRGVAISRPVSAYAWLLPLCFHSVYCLCPNPQESDPAEVPIGLAFPFYTQDNGGVPLDWTVPFLRAYWLGIDHLNEDMPYNFTAVPFCDTQHDILKAVECALELKEHSPVGIVGGLFSDVSLQIAAITTGSRTLQCSPLSTAAELSLEKYSYFFRTVPPDDARAQAIVQAVTHFGWRRIVLIYQTDTYATGLAQKFDEGKPPDTELIRLAEVPEFSTYYSPTEVERIEQAWTREIWLSRARVVLSIMSNFYDQELVWIWCHRAGLLGPNYVWLGLDSFTDLDLDGILAKMDNGQLPPRQHFAGFLLFRSKAESTNRTARLEESALARFGTKLDNTYANGLYDCVMAIGMAAGALLQAGVPKQDLKNFMNAEVKKDLRDAAFNMSFEGASGWVEFQKPKSRNAVGRGAGDRVPTFSIQQYRPTGRWEEVALLKTVEGAPHFVVTGDINFSGSRDFNDSFSGCEAGQEFDVDSFNTSRDVCMPCPAGRFKHKQDRAKCNTCLAGFQCPNGTSEPVACEPGQFSIEGAHECSNCSRGTYTSTTASSVCQTCMKGSVQSDAGKTRCIPCPLGFFQSERSGTACQSCPMSQTTEGYETESPDGCGCPKGSRWVSNPWRCMNCSAGLSCAEFNATPLVMSGYYMDRDAPRDHPHVDMFVCSVPSWCPGEQRLGDPICAEAREGLNCGKCEVGFYQSGHTCHTCTDDHTLLYFLGSLGLFLLCGLLLFLWSRKSDVVEVNEGLLFSVTTGTTVAVVQRLGIIGSVKIEWPVGIREGLALCSSLLSNLVVLTPSCALPTSLMGMYLVRLCTPLLFALTCAMWWGLSKLLHRYALERFPRFSGFQVVNTIGLFMSALYIYTVMGTLSLVDCYQNPSQKRTIRAFSFALCSGPEFNATLPLFALGILVYVAGIVGGTLYALWVAPANWHSNGFRVMIRFLVYKFRPDKYWFGVVMMLASFLMSLVTVIFPDSAFLQLVSMKVIATFQLFAHCIHMPYTEWIANFIDNTQYLGLVIVLTWGSYFLDTPDEDELRSLSFAVLAVPVLMMGIVLWGFGFGLLQVVYPQRAAMAHNSLVDSQVDDILAGCEKILADREGFARFLRLNGTYMERQRAAHLMQLFGTAITKRPSQENLARTGSFGRLLTSVRMRSTRRSTQLQVQEAPEPGTVQEAPGLGTKEQEQTDILGPAKVIRMTL